MGTLTYNAMSTTCRTVHYAHHQNRESDLTIKVNLKMVLPHQRQLQLISIDPELLDYPIMKITTPAHLHRCIKEIKDHICNMLWDTLSISISQNSFRLTLDSHHSGKHFSHALRDNDTIYQSIINWDKAWTCSEVRLTARPPIVW